MKNHLERRKELFATLIGRRLLGVRYYGEYRATGDEDIIFEPRTNYEDAENYLVLVFDGNVELSLFCDGWPVSVVFGDPMIYDGFNFLTEDCGHHDERFEKLELHVDYISLFYRPDPVEFLAMGIKSDTKGDRYDLAFSFTDDAILEFMNVSLRDLETGIGYENGRRLSDFEVGIHSHPSVKS